MRCLVLGGTGMLGSAVVAAARSRGWAALGLSRAQADLTDRDGLRGWAERFRPDVVVNCAAYTKVDAAETERELAFAVNGEGAAARRRPGRTGGRAAGPRLDRLRLRRQGERAVPRGCADGAALRLRPEQARRGAPGARLRPLRGGADELALRPRRAQLRGRHGGPDRSRPAAAAGGGGPAGLPHLDGVARPRAARPRLVGNHRGRAFPEPGARLLVRFRGRDRPPVVRRGRGGPCHHRGISPSRAPSGLLGPGRRALRTSCRPARGALGRGSGRDAGLAAAIAGIRAKGGIE